MKNGTKESLAKAIEDGLDTEGPDTVEELAEALYLDPDTVAGEGWLTIRRSAAGKINLAGLLTVCAS